VAGALPLVHEGQMAGVLSLFAATPFSDEQAQTLQFVLPHLAAMFVSLDRRGGCAAGRDPFAAPCGGDPVSFLRP
jgi:hypothetical protein